MACGPRAHFTDVSSIGIQIHWKFNFALFLSISVGSLQIFSHATAAVACAKFCSNLFMKMLEKVKRNFHQIWIMIEIFLAKWASCRFGPWCTTVVVCGVWLPGCTGSYHDSLCAVFFFFFFKETSNYVCIFYDFFTIRLQRSLKSLWMKDRDLCILYTVLPNPHYRHPIAHPWGRGMGCLLWFWGLIYVLLLSSQHRHKLDCVYRHSTVVNSITTDDLLMWGSRALTVLPEYSG